MYNILSIKIQLVKEELFITFIIVVAVKIVNA